MSVVTSKKPKISAMSSPIGMMTGIVGNLRHGKTQRNRVKRDFDDMSKFLNRGANNIRRFNLPKGQKLKRLTDINIKGGGGGGILGSIMNAVTGGGGLLGLGSNLLGIADFANDIRGLFRRGGKVGRDGRTALQRAKDLKKLKQTGKAVDATQDAVRGARQGTKVLDSVADASKGLRGVSKANAALNIASAGLEFGFRKAEGQTNTQAAVGTAADAAGGMAGFALASKATATALSPLLVTPVPGARILYGIAVLGSGIMGSMAGSKLAASGADKLTGADKVGEDLDKFNQEQEQKKEEQEAKKKELDSPKGRKTFSELLDKFSDIIEKFKTSVKAKKIVRSTTSGSDDGRTGSGSVSVQQFTGAANVIGADHPETGSGYGIAGQVDQNGRPLVFSQPAASAFAGALKESGMNLGSYVASSGRSQEKNTAIGGHENSHHMYGEALDMNGEGYEWMRENGRKFGWEYVYNHGPGSAHFKYVGPGAGTTPKLAPPGNKPSDPEPAPTAAPPTSGNDGARTESQLKRDETKTRAGVDRNTVIDEETGFTAGEMEDIKVKQERIEAMRKALGRDWLASGFDKVTGTASIEGYSKMLRDQGRGDEVDKIMNEIQGGYVEEVETPAPSAPEVTPQVTPSPTPQQVMTKVSTQISDYQSYEQGGGDNLVIMPIGGQSQQPQMMSGPGGQQMMIVPMPVSASVNKIQKELLTTKLAGC